MIQKINATKKGFTIIETIVAIAIFVLGVAATIIVFAKIVQNNDYAMEMGKSSFIVSRSMDDVVSYLRAAQQSDAGAYPLVSANANDLVFYSDYNNDGITERLHIYLSNGNVYMGVSAPSSTIPKTYPPPGTDTKTILLASNIVNTPAQPMFSYYNANYPADTVNNPVAVPADVSTVKLVKIFLEINIVLNRDPDNIQQESFVELRNLNDYDDTN